MSDTRTKGQAMTTDRDADWRDIETAPEGVEVLTKESEDGR